MESWKKILMKVIMSSSIFELRYLTDAMLQKMGQNNWFMLKVINY